MSLDVKLNRNRLNVLIKFNSNVADKIKLEKKYKNLKFKLKILLNLINTKKIQIVIGLVGRFYVNKQNKIKNCFQPDFV